MQRKWQPGDRVYAVGHWEFATVLREHPVEKGWWIIRLDNPDIDGHYTEVSPGEDLVPVEEKHSA